MRLLTLITLMILGALAVSPQQPSPYTTQGLANGLAWREFSLLVKSAYADGALSGYIYGAQALRSSKGCSETAALPNWFPGDASRSVITHEMDTFYEDGANISVPMIDAFEYSLMKLGGATKQELDSFLKAVK